MLGVSELPDWYLTSRYSYLDSYWHQNDFGMKIHYRDLGEGPVVVLIHGEMDSLHAWEGWIEMLSNNFRVIAIDLPGSGLSGATHCVEELEDTCASNLSTDYIKHTLEYFIEDMGIGSFNLVGASYGGYLAADYALRNPDNVDKLVLVSPAGFQQAIPSSLELMTQTSILSRYFQPSPMVTNVVLDFFSHSKPTPNQMKRYLHIAQGKGMHSTNIQSLKFVEDLMTHGSTLDFSTLSTDTLILWGNKDSWSDPELAKLWDETLPQSTLVTYPVLGHALMVELPAITVADASAFLLDEPIPTIDDMGGESFTIEEAAAGMDKEEIFGIDAEAQAEEAEEETTEMVDEP